MAFKMKGNPMKRNFGIGDKPMTKINRGDDKGNPTAAFQKHDGKTFDDPGFMDSHFPSGAPRPMKMKHKSATKLMKDKSAMKLKIDPEMARTGLKPLMTVKRGKLKRTMTSEMKPKTSRSIKSEMKPKMTTKTGFKPTKKVAIHKSKLKSAMAEGRTEGLMERAKKSPVKDKQPRNPKHYTERDDFAHAMVKHPARPSRPSKPIGKIKPKTTPIKMKKKSAMEMKKKSAMKMKKKSAMKSAKDDLNKLKARAEKAGVSIRDKDGTINMGKARAKVRAAEGRKGDVKKLSSGQTMYRGGKKLSKEEANKILARGRTYSRKSAMKKVGRMTDAEKAKAEKARIKKAYLQYQAAEADKIRRGESVKTVMSFEAYKKKMGK